MIDFCVLCSFEANLHLKIIQDYSERLSPNVKNGQLIHNDCPRSKVQKLPINCNRKFDRFSCEDNAFAHSRIHENNRVFDQKQRAHRSTASIVVRFNLLCSVKKYCHFYIMERTFVFDGNFSQCRFISKHITLANYVLCLNYNGSITFQ